MWKFECQTLYQNTLRSDYHVKYFSHDPYTSDNWPCYIFIPNFCTQRNDEIKQETNWKNKYCSNFWINYDETNYFKIGNKSIHTIFRFDILGWKCCWNVNPTSADLLKWKKDWKSDSNCEIYVLPLKSIN